MPMDPRSLQTMLNATVYKDSPIDLVGGMKAEAKNAADGLVDKGKAALSSILSSVGQVVDKYAPSILAGMASVQYRGTQGSFQSYAVPIRLTCRFYRITAADRNAEIGHPTHGYRVLSSMTGFVLCENAKVPLAAPLSEQTAVEEFLNSGIFIE